ncbi:MAG: efflux RND transporter periplasmic adaptor subunit [Planctomycetes bacterium]|nr:efflux RND transporter periplasmic adaptor subunit [Planctomycetota bacterium]
MNSSLLRVSLPIAALAAGIGGLWMMIAGRPPVEKRAVESLPPLVRAVVVKKEDLRMSVRAHGTVRPRHETVLVPQIGGRVVWAAPAFEPGGFFDAGEELLRIDPADYELAVTQARAQVAQAEARLAREEAEAELARREWEAYGKGDPDPLALRVPQLQEARATLEAARANEAQARLNLERTSIRAPFAGRVRAKRVDLGQVVSPGTPLGEIYGTETAEVQLSIPLEDLAYLDLTLGAESRTASEAPEVVLRARLGGTTREWMGRIIRTGPEIDPRTRMIHAVARVQDPYEMRNAPLVAGLFVEAEIRGRVARGVVVLRRDAIREGSRVLVVDEDERLRVREVEVLRTEGERALVRAGLEDGERVCVSPLEIAADGMRVRIQEEAAE